MQLISIESLETMCLKKISNFYRRGKIDAQSLTKGITPKLSLKFGNILNYSAEVQVFSWTNHKVCLCESISFDLYTSISKLRDIVSKKTGLAFSKAYIPKKDSEAGYEKRVFSKRLDAHSWLLDFGYQPGDKITLFFK